MVSWMVELTSTNPVRRITSALTNVDKKRTNSNDKRWLKFTSCSSSSCSKKKSLNTLMERSLLHLLGTPRFGRNEGRPGRNRHQRRKRWSRIACKYPLLYKHVLRETRRLSALPLLILLLHFYLSVLYNNPHCLLHIHPKHHQTEQPTTIKQVKCLSKLILPLLSRMMDVLSVPSLHPLDTQREWDCAYLPWLR